MKGNIKTCRKVSRTPRPVKARRSVTGVIDEKVAIITGASHGIGAGLVAAYRDAGFKVIASSLSIERSTDSNVLERCRRHQ